MGWPEIALIAVVGLLVFGPEKLPGMAKQAAQMVRTVRQMADNAKNDLGREIGQDFSELDLRDLDPREVVRRNLLDSPGQARAPRTGRILRPGERPPFDTEAT
ncbi:sec-independent translocase [Aeromicrobium sp. CF4.19]|uniref:sec-independent translocase n=1 Tax=Aeromicrobium sp. CF4.19 TaxID=3373082 RepID=UPI003EE6F764